MAQIIVATAIMFLALTLFVIGQIFQRSMTRFENGKTRGTAQVVGYDRDGNTSWHTLFVKILELNDGKTYHCSQGLVKKKDYPLGKIVNVEYMAYKTMGINVIEVRLIDLNRKPNNFGKIMYTVAIFLIIISVVIMISGIIQIFQ